MGRMFISRTTYDRVAEFPATMIISAITWAIATAHGNHTIATKARTGLLVALGAGASVAWLIHLGDQI